MKVFHCEISYGQTQIFVDIQNFLNFMLTWEVTTNRYGMLLGMIMKLMVPNVNYQMESMLKRLPKFSSPCSIPNRVMLIIKKWPKFYAHQTLPTFYQIRKKEVVQDIEKRSPQSEIFRVE